LIVIPAEGAKRPKNLAQDKLHEEYRISKDKRPFTFVQGDSFYVKVWDALRYLMLFTAVITDSHTLAL